MFQDLCLRRDGVAEEGLNACPYGSFGNCPIPFEEFMHAALYGSGGFFAGGTLRSQESGDFLTSPEVSPMFGETLATFVRAEGESPFPDCNGNLVDDAGSTQARRSWP